MTSASTRERQGLAIALLGVVGFSFSLPWTVWALESFTPVFTATGRAVIAGALAIVVLVARRVPWPKREQVKPLLYTMAGAIFGWPILIALALERTTAAHAAVIAAVLPLVTAACVGVAGGEPRPEPEPAPAEPDVEETRAGRATPEGVTIRFRASTSISMSWLCAWRKGMCGWR